MKSTLSFLIGLQCCFILSAQDVQNVKTAQVDDQVRIEYQLVGETEYFTYQSKIYISLDGGQTFRDQPLTALTGAVGEISPGVHTVLWSALEEYPEGLTGDYRFKVIVTVTDNSPNQAPGGPRLKSPGNQATDLSVVTNLQWFASGDPEGGTVAYDVYIGELQDPSTLVKANATGFLVTTSVLKAGSTYAWKVVARDPEGNTADSEIWYFHTGGSRENQNSGIDWAGITNPGSGVTLSEKYHANRFDGGDYLFDGWSNTGEVSWIDLYINGTKRGSANNANSGTWSIERELDPGKNEIYIISACNYHDCDRDGKQSFSRTVTYIPDPSGDHVASRNFSNRVEVDIFGYSLNGMTTYYQIWRSDENKVFGAGWKRIQDWSTNAKITDTDVESGNSYYYFFRAAPNSNGTYDSNYSTGAYGYVR